MKMIFGKNTKQYLLGACIFLCALIILILLVKYVLLDPTKIEVEQVEESKIASEVLAPTADFQKGLDAARSGDYATAIKEWQPLAEQGNTELQFNIGWMYDTGNGVIQDYQESLKWYRLAAEQGHAKAQYNLGVRYSKGQDVIQDYKEAVKWFRLAAEQEDVNAQNNMGLMYGEGRGVVQDYKEAVKWWRLSAEQGHPEAQTSLGYMHENGFGGLIQDIVVAHMWYNIADFQGSLQGKINLDMITKEMTAFQIEKAQDLARQCQRNNYKGC